MTGLDVWRLIKYVYGVLVFWAADYVFAIVALGQQLLGIKKLGVVK